jgi:hypothetical protein
MKITKNTLECRKQHKDTISQCGRLFSGVCDKMGNEFACMEQKDISIFLNIEIY